MQSVYPGEPGDASVSYDAAAEFTAQNLDRIWFDRHPGRRVYMRFAIPGETTLPLIPIDIYYWCTIVAGIEPGARARTWIAFERRSGVFVPRWKERDLIAAFPETLRKVIEKKNPARKRRI